MTSMWMVQDDDGGWLQHNGEQFYCGYGYAMESKIAMNNWIIANPDIHAHLVEMVPAKPKVPVSREEAETLDYIANEPSRNPLIETDIYVRDHFEPKKWISEQLRLMKAMFDGYTVVEPTKYNVKVPHVEDSVYGKMSDGILTVYDGGSKCDFMQFTMDEIKHYGLEDCERVEINTEDSDDN